MASQKATAPSPGLQTAMPAGGWQMVLTKWSGQETLQRMRMYTPSKVGSCHLAPDDLCHAVMEPAFYLHQGIESRSFSET